jgi:predicted kinase
VATVFAVAGFLGTGRTTFSRELERATGGVRISIDEWTIGLSGDDFALDPEIFSRTRNLLDELWPRIAKAGADVILDFGFWRREDRNDTRARAIEAGAEFRLYWLQCSEESSRIRAIGRREAGSYLFDEASFDHLRTRFEPLADDEDFEVVNT